MYVVLEQTCNKGHGHSGRSRSVGGTARFSGLRPETPTFVWGVHPVKMCEPAKKLHPPGVEVDPVEAARARAGRRPRPQSACEHGHVDAEDLIGLRDDAGAPTAPRAWTATPTTHGARIAPASARSTRPASRWTRRRPRARAPGGVHNHKALASTTTWTPRTSSASATTPYEEMHCSKLCLL